MLEPGSLAKDYQARLSCWTNGPEGTPGCDWIVPPGGACEGGVVGDEYPYKTDKRAHSSGVEMFATSRSEMGGRLQLFRLRGAMFGLGSGEDVR